MSTKEPNFSSETMSTEKGDNSDTRVYWNIDDFPIPEGFNLDSYSEIIKSSIDRVGFYGEVSIWAYCEKTSESLYYDSGHAGIVLQERVEGDIDNMSVDIILWALSIREEPLNLIVISKNISEETELFGVLQELDSVKENYNIYVPNPDKVLKAGWFSLTLFSKGNADAGWSLAVDQSGSSHEAKTGLFWNIEDCPIPEGLDPNEIYQNVKSALANQACHGEVSIWAYCEKNDSRSFADVTMLPVGDQSARFKKMLRDILFWALRNPPVHYAKTSPTLMVISRSRGFVDVLYSLLPSGYNVLLALPDAVEYVSSLWLHPSLTGSGNPVIDQSRTGWGNPIIDQSESSHLVLNKGKKRKRSERRRLTYESQSELNSLRNSMVLSHGVANKGKKIQKQTKSVSKKLRRKLWMGKKIQKQTKSVSKKLRREIGKKARGINHEATTGVFWNFDGYPILGLDKADQFIKSALDKQGYHGDVSIRAYWEKGYGFCYWPCRFIPVQNRVSEGHGLSVEVDTMFLDILLWALDHPAPSNLMVISKNISEETELLSLLQALERKGYNILLPQAKTILCGEEPIFQDVPNEGIQMKSSSKMHEANTFVFWNIEDCPIPGGLDPRTFLQNIKSALANHGCLGDVSITAYREKNRSFDDLSLTDNITLVPTGNQHARIKKMLTDILFWALEYPKTSSVMVITKEFPDNVYDALCALKSIGYNFLFADPSAATYANSVWLSTKLFGGGNPIGTTTKGD